MTKTMSMALSGVSVIIYLRSSKVVMLLSLRFKDTEVAADAWQDRGISNRVRWSVGYRG